MRNSKPAGNLGKCTSFAFVDVERHCLSSKFLYHIVGIIILTDTMVMMEFFTMAMQSSNRLAQLSLQEIQLVLVSIMLPKNFFSRMIDFFLKLH